MEENGVVDTSVDDVWQGWRLEDNEIYHVVHTDDIVLSRGSPVALLDPEKVLFREKMRDDKLDPFHFFQPLLDAVSL